MVKKEEVSKTLYLSEINTCDLVNELRRREGVTTEIAEPYEEVKLKVNGPAIVLVVID